MLATEVRACTVVLAMLVVGLCASVSPALQLYSPRGDWSPDWPEELEPYRKRATTEDLLPLGGLIIYTIPFKDRPEFEKIWPVLLGLKTKGAPLTLLNAPVKNSQRWPEGSHPGVRVYAPPSSQWSKDSPLHSTSKKTWARTTLEIHLFVDGKIVNLNRIRLPADTPIIDKRELLSQPKQPSTQTAIARPKADAAPLTATRPADDAVPLDPQALLAKLRTVDAVYRKGFTAAGTDIGGWPSTKHEWQLTVAGDYFATVRRAIEILDQDANKPFKLPDGYRSFSYAIAMPLVHIEKAILVTPDYCVVNTLIENTPAAIDGQGGTRLVDFGRVAINYMGEIHWVLGRGLPQYITQITRVARQPDGTLTVTAVCGGDLKNSSWELRVDPAANYIIRSGKGHGMEFSNSGTQWFGKCCIPEKGVWLLAGEATTLEFQTASLKPDRELLRKIEAMMYPPFKGGAWSTQVMDERVWPELSAAYAGGQVTAPVDYARPGHPDSMKKLEEQSVQPRRAAEVFLAAFLAGEEESTAPLLAPGSSVFRQLPELRQATVGVAELKAKSVHFAGDKAIVLTSDVPTKSDPAAKAPVFIRLAKPGERWLLDRIDADLEAPFPRRMTHLLGEDRQ